MSAHIIDGKAISLSIRKNIKEQVDKLKQKFDKVPGLAVVLVGDDPASQIYVRNKEKACKDVGIYSEIYRLEKNISENRLLELIGDLNDSSDINGILVQLPLPDHISEMAVIRTISPDKDVDGFHSVNAGKLLNGEKGFVPCTPRGIIELIKSTNNTIDGKDAVVVGRSNIVGKPVSILLLRENATVTICHSKTRDLRVHTQKADILVAATGKPNLISGDMIKPGAIVIDVGTSRINGKLVGDVHFESAKEVAGWITPVPGGVGPMTITMLLANTVEAAAMQWNL